MIIPTETIQGMMGLVTTAYLMTVFWAVVFPPVVDTKLLYIAGIIAVFGAGIFAYGDARAIAAAYAILSVVMFASCLLCNTGRAIFTPKE